MLAQPLKVIDLVNVDRSKVKIINYPDGQVDAILTDGEYPRFGGIQIKARFRTYEDLNIITCVVRALRRKWVVDIDLYIPWLLGARSDTMFEDGSCMYLQDVVAPPLNLLQLRSVTVLDPHSLVTQNVINNLYPISNLELCEWAFDDMIKLGEAKSINEVTIVSPDGGAIKKTDKVATALGYTCEVIYASKHREHGKSISRTKVPVGDTIHKPFPYVIIDDICDGGGTFLAAADVIKSSDGYIGQDIYLIVTHLIMSKGHDELEKRFKRIYSTNSYRTIKDPAGFIKQLNVF